MILEAIFIQLRRGRPTKFFASVVLSFYGDRFIKRPTMADLPKEAGEEVNQRIIDTWFNVQEDRLPPKRLPNWEVGQLKASQIRDVEQHQVARAVVLNTAILCTMLAALGGMVSKLQPWWEKRQAAAVAEEAREYALKREDLKKEWAAEIAGYSAQKCLDEVSDLRKRTSPERRDRYAALESGCAQHREAIAGIARTWSLDDCADFGIEANKVMADGGQATWVDRVLFQDICFPKYGDALQARVK